MVFLAPNRGKFHKAIQEKAKIQANRTASANAYAQPTHPIKKEKRSKIKTKRIFASHAREKVNYYGVFQY